MMHQAFAATVEEALKKKLMGLEARLLLGECSDFTSYRATVKERLGILDTLKAMRELAKIADNT